MKKHAILLKNHSYFGTLYPNLNSKYKKPQPTEATVYKQMAHKNTIPVGRVGLSSRRSFPTKKAKSKHSNKHRNEHPTFTETWTELSEVYISSESIHKSPF